MMINNGIYFVFWLLFFDRFQEIRGYQIDEIFMLFAVLTLAFGIAFTFAGNASQVAYMVAQGRLDYYLALPRPVLSHLIFSRMGQSTAGDLAFGLLAFLFTGKFDPVSIVLFIVVTLLAAVLFVNFAVIAGSLSFFLGNSALLSDRLMQTMLTFGLYPFGLFQGVVRLILLTIIPAAFIGAVPVEVVNTHSFTMLGGLVGAALFGIVIMTVVFRVGLRRYESGSAINVNI